MTINCEVDDSHTQALRTTWSPTSLNLFIKCPLAFWFEKAQGWRQVPTEALTAGNLVHSVLEEFLALSPPERTRESARGLFTKHWDATSHESQVGIDLGIVHATSGEALSRYFTLEDPVVVSPIADGLERAVGGSLAGIAIGGKVDRIECGIDGLRITDYKTGKANPAHARAYWRQQLIYAALLGQDPSIDEFVSEVSLLYMGDPCGVLTRPVTPTGLQRVSDELSVAQEQRDAFQERGSWEARTSALCKYCSFFSVCPAKVSGAPTPGSEASNEKLAKSPKIYRVKNLSDAEADHEGES